MKLVKECILECINLLNIEESPILDYSFKFKLFFTKYPSKCMRSLVSHHLCGFSISCESVWESFSMN